MVVENIQDLKEHILYNSLLYKNNKKNWNLDNIIFLEDILSKLGKIEYTKTKLDKKLQQIIAERCGGNVSLYRKEYWKSIDWTEDIYLEKISEIQKTNSKTSTFYWIKKGFSQIESEEKVKEYQTKVVKNTWNKSSKMMKENNPIFVEYWIKKGFSLEDAQKKVNPSCEEFRNYKNEEGYIAYKKTISENVKKLWADGVFDDKLYNSRRISKEEIECFSILIKLIPKIIHIPFGINTRKISDIKYIVYDGYLKTNLGIILFEYDGTYWHNDEYDEKREEMTFEIRKDVLGIIRISDTYYKTNLKNSNKIKKDITYAITKIKNQEFKKIKL